MRVLITGATGLLGNNVARLAIARGVHVTTLSRSSRQNPALAGLDIDVRQGDLGSSEGLNSILDDSFDAIIHCAAHIHIGWKFLDEAMHINRDGTEALLAIARRRGGRFIHVSTVNTLAIGSREHPANEETNGDGQVPCTYVLSKRAAEAAANGAYSEGQDVVFIHPGFMLGPWDWKPSSGKMITELQKRFAPLSPSGGCSVCDPRDVACAVLNALERGVSGRRYITAGHNVTYLQLWRDISRAVGKRGPMTYMRFPARFLASHIGDLINRFRTSESEVNSAAIAMASQFHWYSSQRAIDELDYRIRPAEESIRDAVNWFRERGYLPAKLNSDRTVA